MSAILDSGNRRTFQTGAVRDIQEGKGRCDLLPLLPIYNMLRDDILFCVNQFEDSGDPKYLLEAVLQFSTEFNNSVYTMLLEVSIHFEQGAQKYGENNWQKGIPVHCYIDSAIRHYLKYKRGDDDERHDRAFVWNVLCAIWTCKVMPELNEYGVDTDDNVGA